MALSVAYDIPENDVIYPRTRIEEIVLETKLRSVKDFVDVARDLITFSETNGEKTRRDRIARRRSILWDSWQYLLREDLKNRLSWSIYQAVCGSTGNLVDISRNPCRDIWQEMATLYRSHARRFTEPPESGQKYIDLTNGTKFGTFWQTVETALQAFNDVVVWPTIIERNGKKVVRHRWTAGDAVCVSFSNSDTSEPESVLLIDEFTTIEGEDKTHYHFWTDNWRGLFDEKHRRLDPATGIEIPDDAEGWENPIGELPFVFIHKSPHHPHFWDQSTGEDLIQLTLKTGRQQTYMNYLLKMSSHKQLVVAGEDIPKVESQLLDPGAIVKIRAATPSFQLVDWQVDFTKLQSVIDADEIRAAASRGINAEKLRKTSYQTSSVAELSERGLVERRERNEEIFKEAEAEYYRKFCLIAKMHNIPNAPDPNVQLEVIHAPITYPTDPMANLEFAKQKASVGASSLLDLILQDHPTWSEDRALDYLTRNIEQLSEIQNIKSARNIPADLSNESMTAEQNGAMGPVVRDSKPTEPGAE